ncbi:MAG: macro domain-containing protein [Anaerolineae bacterium]|nr:MAG: macro domain-containing protein [Anaerolineae bacterium]
MIRFTQGNLLDAEVEAVVNTVNTVGVMGKGIALMFKEAFPENSKRYAAACKAGEVKVGHVFVTERHELMGPRWIVNFPTKKHWRHPSKMEWVVDGLRDLRTFILEKGIKSIAIPPLGSGNGGLNWTDVRDQIQAVLANLDDVDIVVYEPTSRYQNVAKRTGVKKLTPARALIAELVRRYWVLGIECTLLEVQKLAWFLERKIEQLASDNPLDLRFDANKYGPYANRLDHLLNALDGSYLHCDKRIADAGPLDIIWFDDAKKDYVQTYLKSEEAKPYLTALEATSDLIDGFESPLGVELLATVDWLLFKENCPATVEGIKECLKQWPGGTKSTKRKMRLFDDRLISLALDRLSARHAT